MAAKDGSRWTALILAVEGGHRAVVELLLRRGADVAARTEMWARTALDLAGDGGCADMGGVDELLLSWGADKYGWGGTALH